MRRNASDVEMWFGLAVKTRRLAMEWSISTLAKMVGLTTRQLEMIERADAVTRLTDVQAIANAFGIDLNEITRPPIATARETRPGGPVPCAAASSRKKKATR